MMPQLAINNSIVVVADTHIRSSADLTGMIATVAQRATDLVANELDPTQCLEQMNNPYLQRAVGLHCGHPGLQITWAQAIRSSMNSIGIG